MSPKSLRTRSTLFHFSPFSARSYTSRLHIAHLYRRLQRMLGDDKSGVSFVRVKKGRVDKVTSFDAGFRRQGNARVLDWGQGARAALDDVDGLEGVEQIVLVGNVGNNEIHLMFETRHLRPRRRRSQQDRLEILDVGANGGQAHFRHVRVDRLQQHVMREDVLIFRLDEMIALLTNVLEET